MLGHFRTRGSDDARISVGAQILGGIKTESRRHTERSRRLARPPGSNRLRGVFYNCHVKFLRQAAERVHVGALSIEMNRQNRSHTLRAEASQPLRDSIRIKIERRSIDVDKDWHRSRSHNRTGGSKETKRGRDDRIPRLYSRGHQRQPQCFGPGSASNRSRGSRQRSDLAFKRLYLRPKNKNLRIAHPRNRRQHLLADAFVLSSQVEEWHRSLGNEWRLWKRRFHRPDFSREALSLRNAKPKLGQ